MNKTRVNNVDYKESVIVPLDTYNRMCVKSKSSDVPIDLKVKLADQNEWARRQVGSSRSKREHIRSDPSKRKIASLKTKLKVYHPFLEDILVKYVQRYPEQIDWHPETYEIILDGQIISKSNILRSLTYLLAPETFDYRRPVGAEMLREKLLSLGVNEGWLYGEHSANDGARHQDRRIRERRKTEAKSTPDIPPSSVKEDITPLVNATIEAINKRKDLVEKTTTSKTPVSRPSLRENFQTPALFQTPPLYKRKLFSDLDSSERKFTTSKKGPGWFSATGVGRGTKLSTRTPIEETSTIKRKKDVKWSTAPASFSPISSRTRKHQDRLDYSLLSSRGKQFDWVTK